MNTKFQKIYKQLINEWDQNSENFSSDKIQEFAMKKYTLSVEEDGAATGAEREMLTKKFTITANNYDELVAALENIISSYFQEKYPDEDLTDIVNDIAFNTANYGSWNESLDYGSWTLEENTAFN